MSFLVLVMCIATPFITLQVSAQTSVETDFMTILNTDRVASGKSPIAINSQLTTAAYLHSKDMAEQNYFSHTSLDGRTFDKRIVAAGYTNYSALAENIAYAYGGPDAARVYNMWKNSSGHYTNMMGAYNEAGLGFFSKNGYTYYTLDLGKGNAVQIPEIPSFVLLLVFFSLASVFAPILLKRATNKKAILPDRKRVCLLELIVEKARERKEGFCGRRRH